MRAARHEFLERGVAATPLRAIARRARTNLGMIYYYFPSKDELFLAIIEEPYAKMVDSVAAILGQDAPLHERIRALYRRLGAATIEEGETFRLVIGEGMKSATLRSRLFARVWRGHLPLLFKALEDGKRDGLLAASAPTPLLGIVTAAVGLLPQIVLRLMPLGIPADDALADKLADLLFEGIGSSR